MYDKREVIIALKEHSEIDIILDGIDIVDGQIVFNQSLDDDFFNIDTDHKVNIDKTMEQMEVMDKIAYTEKLLEDIEKVARGREYDICLMLTTGRSIEKIAKLFNVSRQRIDQQLNQVINRLCEAHKQE